MLRKVERTGQKFGLTLKLFFFAELILSQWRRWDEEPDCLTEKPQIFKLVAVFGLVFIFVDKYVRNWILIQNFASNWTKNHCELVSF